MRLEGVTAPQVDTTGGSERTNIEKALRMSEGDVIHARVLSVGDGTASLRTSDGALLSARLENGVMLSPGADVYLSVKDSGSEITVLSPVNPELAMTGVRRSDPLLEAVFNQLVSLGYEPTAENMSAMRQLLAEIPDMPLREAAFFAAQGLDPEPALLDAFRAVASGEADTASLLDKLSVAVSAPAESAETPAAPDMNAPAVPGAFADSEMHAAIAPQAPLTAEKSEAENTAPATRSAPEPENTAAQEGADAARANTVRPEADMTLPEFGRWILEALGAGAPKTGGTESAPVLTGETLAESPLLGGLSERGFAEIAEILNRIAVEMPKTGGESELFENISKLAKELFVRPGGDGAELRGRLKEIREDLYIKLSYFRDAAANSPAQSKGAVLEQAQKLMDHLRLLNGLDQFVFVQIPIRLGDERRNADLYIYKREKSGSSRIDPENVKILLALDLIHMGRLETLVEIQGRDVSLQFEAASDDVINVLRRNTATIHRFLADIGYKFANSTFATKKSATTVETALLSLLESRRGRGGINMII